MCSLLSQIRIPLPRPDPSPSPTQMVCLLNGHESSNTLVQTVFVTLLIYSSVQVHGPYVGPFPASRTHDILLALGFLASNVRPEQFAGGPVTAGYSQLVLKHIVLEGAQSAV